LIHTFPTRVVEHVYGGNPLKVFLSDPLAEGWYDHDWADLPEIDVLKRGRLRPGARVFDIGAHQGVVAAMLANVVGPSGRVVAVEASPHNSSAALRNRELNGLTQIEVVQAAASDEPGTLVFNEGLNGQLDDGTGAGGRLLVEAVTIDGLADRFGLPDVVFLDIEGAECLALSGASRVLASAADFFVEVHAGCGLEQLGGSVAEVLSRFPEDQFAVSIRAESDASFRPPGEGDSLRRDRFFLIARRRGSGQPGPSPC
jgi:FkbM family methyltransferase